ncbi:hypothetical protein HK098_003266 [Nowakowskiella sp. JEL0407]|nr:hypothetical protein HK098_003266 [Nowakowskiella sp. JEL0407]
MSSQNGLFTSLLHRMKSLHFNSSHDLPAPSSPTSPDRTYDIKRKSARRGKLVVRISKSEEILKSSTSLDYPILQYSPHSNENETKQYLPNIVHHERFSIETIKPGIGSVNTTNTSPSQNSVSPHVSRVESFKTCQEDWRSTASTFETTDSSPDSIDMTPNVYESREKYSKNPGPFSNTRSQFPRSPRAVINLQKKFSALDIKSRHKEHNPTQSTSTASNDHKLTVHQHYHLHFETENDKKQPGRLGLQNLLARKSTSDLHRRSSVGTLRSNYGRGGSDDGAEFSTMLKTLVQKYYKIDPNLSFSFPVLEDEDWNQISETLISSVQTKAMQILTERALKLSQIYDEFIVRKDSLLKPRVKNPVEIQLEEIFIFKLPERNHTFKFISIFGVVSSIRVVAEVRIYTIDDATGVIDTVLINQIGQELKLGDNVRILGELRCDNVVSEDNTKIFLGRWINCHRTNAKVKYSVDVKIDPVNEIYFALRTMQSHKNPVNRQHDSNIKTFSSMQSYQPIESDINKTSAKVVETVVNENGKRPIASQKHNIPESKLQKTEPINLESEIEALLSQRKDGCSIAEIINFLPSANQQSISETLVNEAQGKMADWNRHRGVGATLLENYVEERAVGQTIEIERQNMAKLNKFGHKDILVHKIGENTYNTTHADGFKKFERKHIQMGKRRAELEARLMEEAKKLPEVQIDRSAKDWLSTAHADFGHEDYYGAITDLAKIEISEEDIKKYSKPRTFWTDHAIQGHGTVYSSTKISDVAGKSVGSVKFGKHAAFSTPIKEAL